MKKLVKILTTAAVLASSIATVTACGEQGGKETKTYELAVVTDVGQLMDGGFNQGTYEGVENYAKANNLSYNYYAPANGADATDADRIAAMELAISKGAKVIVTPGFLQATAIETVAKAHTDVKFVFVDGWPLGYDNVTAIAYKEQEAGYFAGYAAVKDGYTKLGGTFGGGGTNPACNRYGYGYVQGANAAAKELGKTVEVTMSYKYGDAFSASPELQTQIAGWYANGTEIVFSCGGSMLQSVKAAAEATANGKIIGVDVDQSGESDRVVTSAFKGLSTSVELILKEYYAGKWDSALKNNLSNLGATEDATGIPTASGSWRFKTFTTAEYDKLFADVKSGKVTIKTDGCDGNVNTAEFWAAANAEFTNVNVTLD